MTDTVDRLGSTRQGRPGSTNRTTRQKAPGRDSCSYVLSSLFSSSTWKADSVDTHGKHSGGTDKGKKAQEARENAPMTGSEDAVKADRGEHK